MGYSKVNPTPLEEEQVQPTHGMDSQSCCHTRRRLPERPLTTSQLKYTKRSNGVDMTY